VNLDDLYVEISNALWCGIEDALKSSSKKEAGLDVSHHALVPTRGGERFLS